MKHWIFLVLVCFAAPVGAQDKPAPKPEAAKEEQAKKQKQAAATPRKAGKRWNEDARHCLERPTNTEIIKCAEEYL